MTSRRNTLAAVGVAGLLALAGAAAATPASASGSSTSTGSHEVAELHALNNSGVTGHASVRVQGTNVRARVDVTGAAPKLVHAQHIHFGAQAAHECPTVRDDANHDFRLNVAEGVPKYGPIAVSLTTKGDTSPTSGLAVDRMPVANAHGNYGYHRTDITVFSTKDQNARAVAEAIRKGQGVLVVHGVDYNNNGMYDFAGAGKSELNEAVPAEATDPAACGVLHN